MVARIEKLREGGAAVTFWSNRRVLVAGGSGFIGSHLVEALLDSGGQVRVAGRSEARLKAAIGDRASEVEYIASDLASPESARHACQGMDAVFNLAAEVAGVGFNSQHPGSSFSSNVRTGVTLLDAAAREGVERFLVVSSACVYRRHAMVPTPETEGFVDDPEPTNLGYGWAKRVLELQARCYSLEFPMKIGIARPYNAYGPRDNFAWETSHVIPALIRKVLEGQNPLRVWGDGTQTRSFLYVTDFVTGLMLTLERYAVCEPVNIGSDEEVTIGRLVELIVDLAGNRVRVEFDADKPGGQPRRLGDYTRALEAVGFRAAVPLAEGLRRTIEWYRRAHDEANPGYSHAQ